MISWRQALRGAVIVYVDAASINGLTAMQ